MIPRSHKLLFGLSIVLLFGAGMCAAQSVWTGGEGDTLWVQTDTTGRVAAFAIRTGDTVTLDDRGLGVFVLSLETFEMLRDRDRRRDLDALLSLIFR